MLFVDPSLNPSELKQFQTINGLQHLVEGRRFKAGNYVKDIKAGRCLQKSLVESSILAKSYSTDASLQKDIPSTVERDFKGHDMLAPFTAGWQTTDVNPLVIEKSEGSYVYDTNGKKYLDALAGLWCTALALNDEMEEESQTLGEVLRIKEIMDDGFAVSEELLFECLRRIQLMNLPVEILKVRLELFLLETGPDSLQGRN